MKNILLSLLILFSLNFLKAQQYYQNVAFDSTLIGGHNFVNGCMQTIQTNIQLDTSLFSYVDGLRFLLILDTVHFNGPISSIHSGDTIILNSTNPVFTTISSGLTDFWYRIKVVGTPITVNQNYPCKIETMQCTCFCLDILLKKSSVDNSICYVDLLNNIYDTEKQKKFNIYPNPAINKFTISNIVEKSTIQLYSSLGEIIFEKEIYSDFTIDTSSLSAGIYSLVISNEAKSFTSIKIVAENSK